MEKNGADELSSTDNPSLRLIAGQTWCHIGVDWLCDVYLEGENHHIKVKTRWTVYEQ